MQAGVSANLPRELQNPLMSGRSRSRNAIAGEKSSAARSPLDAEQAVSVVQYPSSLSICFRVFADGRPRSQ